MKQIISLVLAMAAMSVLAQSNVSAPMDFHIEGDVMPAVLNIVPGTFQFVDQDTNNVINPNEPCKIRFQVINYGSGDGYGCVARTLFSGNTEGINISDVPLPVVPAGNKRWVEIPILVGDDIETGELALDVAVEEPHGFGTGKIQFKVATFQPNAPISKAVHEVISEVVPEVKPEIKPEVVPEPLAKVEPEVLPVVVPEASPEVLPDVLLSDVDVNIPHTDSTNDNTFVVVIANENYEQVDNVPFALNDGEIFRQYCERTLGIPNKNIKIFSDASYNHIRVAISWLRNICEVFDDAQIIFYYAGHGIPDESSRTAYLLPVDGLGTDVATGYKLDELYAALGNIPAKNVTVFMDACFSGSKREHGMLASARGVAIKAISGMPQGRMVVFSAAQGDETAYPNHEKKHGMFTYYLLKKLQDTAGDVTLQELGDYITKNVRQQSILINGKSQTPCVTPSATLDASWREWKLM